MKQKSWFKTRAFSHITPKLYVEDSTWIKNYVSNPHKISSHAFYPLVHKTIASKRFKASLDKVGKTIKRHYTYHKGKRKTNTKYREIYYPNHLDSHIYSYYNLEILSPLYEAIMTKNVKLNESIIGYRRIPVKNESRCKCNIDFANEVFDRIKEYQGDTAVLALDISKFFDSLDHKILKQAWAKLIGRADLKKDHYAVYKSLTNFSFVEINDLLKEFKLKHPNQIIQKGINNFVSSGEEFRKRIKANGYIKNNPFRNSFSEEPEEKTKVVGIPQGTPLSAFLANLYLLDFDKEILELLKNSSGVYRRYSDDLLIICPQASSKDIEENVYTLIKKFRLVIQESKTQRTLFSNGKLQKGQKPVSYLGFQFDGKRKLIRPASLSKFYRKMKASVKFRAYKASLAKKKGITKRINVDSKLFRKKLYDQYSYLGSVKSDLKKRNYFSYANFASKVMRSPHIKKQLSKAWKILHTEISKQEAAHRLPKLKKVNKQRKKA